MKYTLQELPAPIRQQVEDYIEFLLAKYPATPDAPGEPPVSNTPGKTFAARWRGIAKGVDPDSAKASYLDEKYG